MKPSYIELPGGVITSVRVAAVTCSNTSANTIELNNPAKKPQADVIRTFNDVGRFILLAF